MMYREKFKVNDIDDTTVDIKKLSNNGHHTTEQIISIEKENIPGLIKKLNEVK